jgi:hypothetical protein
MIMYGTLLGLAVLPAAAAIWFFVLGLGDGSVSEFNILLWLGLLAVACGVPALGAALQGNGQALAAKLVLALGAVPAAIGIVVLLVLIVAPPRWH